MKKFNNLAIACDTNPDWNGRWRRSEVEDEMRGLGIAPGGAWEYVMFNVFDSPVSFGGIDYDAMRGAIEAGGIRDAAALVDGHEVRISQN